MSVQAQTHVLGLLLRAPACPRDSSSAEHPWPLVDSTSRRRGVCQRDAVAEPSTASTPAEKTTPTADPSNNIQRQLMPLCRQATRRRHGRPQARGPAE
ncbi:uncharacterized protein SCHCODRAFT_02109934 [Schizophyllum commune H4-8]|uniref:uncharacterized protein n=1 Tax=Schizophyllum commune (strain H4-8 / FGSC 9210) TaxID=578458 RepID=UPI00215E0A3C|nr:uncharacterized protein SCHCODRAFT_02109934 [Schizophyllum commune H4-8]KAI5885975.1 hypothetical protein SCHCODRAFT_02109934 [Schizophyllum commune H4-8]